ncbi:MFS transporter [Staphylococcus aureus]
MALPIILVFMLVCVFADNFDRQKIIQNCDWLCGICSLLIVLSLLFKSLIFIFIRSMIKAFFNPAHSAIIQGILEEDEYPIAVRTI